MHHTIIQKMKDDANGCNLEGNTAEPIVKVGLLAQAPVGDGGIRVYENLSIQKMTVKNIRAGK